MTHRRSICIFTATRADYGHLRWLMEAVRDDPDLRLQTLVSGTHLCPQFGETYRVLLEDGFEIDARVDMVLSNDTPEAVTKSAGLGMIGFADALERLKPDVLVILGDRYEALALAQAALIAGIPIAHLHGGELTEGAMDEAMRHAITKLAHLHFVAAEPYRAHVVQMGELPDRVFNFGAPGLDAVQRLDLLSRSDLETQLDFRLGETSFLVTYHPETLSAKEPGETAAALLAALDHFPQARIIFTGHNADPKGHSIGAAIQSYAGKHAERVRSFASLGQLCYLSALSHVDVVVGNSSSGLIEAPVFKKPTVNIGDRQRGRLQASSVIDCGESAQEIGAALEKALSTDFQATLATTQSLYGQGNVSGKIKETLKTVDLDGILRKRFYTGDPG
jgi:UDP-N-acetylglucosamine 2-epimerase (non-hydrolysing)/GDP/UDP-N,N'-diacetylbacillosamine 2-epimerase (hydrolysing)